MPLYTPTQRKQVATISFTLIFVYISMTFGLIIFPLLGLSIYSPFMFLSLSLLAFVINKSLWIKIAVVDIVEEINKLLGMFASAFVIFSLWTLTGSVTLDLNIVGKFLASLSIVILINGIYSYFQRVYNNKRIQAQGEVLNFIDITTKIINREELVKLTKESIYSILKPERIEFEFFHNENLTPIQTQFTKWWSLRSKTIIINKETLIESYFDRENNKEITKELYEYLQKEKISVMIPLTNKDSLIALINIYNTNDVLDETQYNNLSLLSSTLSVSLNRALLYEELQDFNKTLQKKVDSQTAELQEKVKLLEEARKKEADMIDIMGHELRTPATIVKLNTDLLSQFSENNSVENEETYKKYVSRIKHAVETEITLINTLLSSAKLEGDKVELNMERIDIYKEVEMSMHAEEDLAKEKGLEFTNLIPENISNIYADRTRVAEILNNLISNAVKYTEKGSVTVSGSEDEKYVHIEVQDTGRGISKEDQKNLGTKFFRTKTYIDSEIRDDFDIVRPGGTGLGLYVTFGLLEKMGGKINIESEIGKGSTFTASFAKYTNQQEHKIEEGTRDMFSKLGLR